MEALFRFAIGEGRGGGRGAKSWMIHPYEEVLRQCLMTSVDLVKKSVDGTLSGMDGF